MENFLRWVRNKDVMVQFHPAAIGPNVMILLSDKDLNHAEGFILPGEEDLLPATLERLYSEMEGKRGQEGV